MGLALESPVTAPPVHANQCAKEGHGLTGRMIQPNPADGGDHEPAAEHSGTITAVFGEELGQRSKSCGRFSQFEPSKSAPSREGAPAEHRSGVTTSAEANLAEDALAGEELGGEADGEAQHG
mgnify:CR=1 FL=1